MSDGVVEIYSDGACRGNPARAAGGVLLRYDGAEKELWGGEAATTNNRMELTAAIRALEALKRPSRVRLYTDSLYVMKGISPWIGDWKRRGWRTADKKPVKNDDLWRRLDELAATHEIEWHWCAATPGIPKTSGRTARQPGNTTLKQIVLDTETTGLKPQAGRPHHRDRLRRAAQPAPERARLPRLHQPEREVELRRDPRARPDARGPRGEAQVCRGGGRIPRLHPRRRAHHPQRRLRRRVPQHGARARRLSAARCRTMSPRSPTRCFPPRSCIRARRTRSMRFASATSSTTQAHAARRARRRLPARRVLPRDDARARESLVMELEAPAAAAAAPRPDPSSTSPSSSCSARRRGARRARAVPRRDGEGRQGAPASGAAELYCPHGR